MGGETLIFQNTPPTFRKESDKATYQKIPETDDLLLINSRKVTNALGTAGFVNNYRMDNKNLLVGDHSLHNYFLANASSAER